MKGSFPSYYFQVLVFGKQILNCGPFTISSGWSESSKTGLEVQEGSWSCHLLRVPPLHSSKCNWSCCFMLRKINCCVYHISKGKITATSEYLNTVWKHSGCRRRHTHQVFHVRLFTVILWWERNCICLMSWQGSQSMLGTFLEKNLYSAVSSAAVHLTRLLLLSLKTF